MSVNKKTVIIKKILYYLNVIEKLTSLFQDPLLFITVQTVIKVLIAATTIVFKDNCN